MSARFDPYHVWLGIAPAEQPANHYRLLGVPLFENNPAVIEHAADRQMTHLRSLSAGKHEALSQQLLNEVSAARVCLLNPEQKAAYDAELRAKLPSSRPAPTAKPAVDPGLAAVAAQAAKDRHNALAGKGGHAVHAAKPSAAPVADPSVQPPSTALRWSLIGGGIGCCCLLAGVLVWLIVDGKPADHAPSPAQIAAEKPADKPRGEKCFLSLDWPEAERAGAKATMDNQPVPVPPTGPIHLVVRPGPHALRIEWPDRPPFEKNLLALSGENPLTIGRAAPVSADAVLELVWSEEDRAGAGCTIDGKEVAVPSRGKIEHRLAAGDHRVVVRWPDLASCDESFALRAGERKSLVVRKPPPAAPAPPDAVVNALGMQLVLVPAGEFEMGSTPADIARVRAEVHNEARFADRLDNEGPRHRVRITRPFHLGAHEVTQRQYQAIMGENPSKFSPTGKGASYVEGVADTGDYPVEQVSWDNAREFCRRLSERSEERQAGRVYRLPTEAEWEYACRAGSAGDFCCGERGRAGDYVWSGENSAVKPRPVGGKRPNAWGLYDMHGSVWEWCADWYAADYYAQSPAADPKGPAAGTHRVLRGGSWRTRIEVARCAFRWDASQIDAWTVQGFRVACDVGGAPTGAPPIVPSQPPPPLAGRQPAPTAEELAAANGHVEASYGPRTDDAGRMLRDAATEKTAAAKYALFIGAARRYAEAADLPAALEALDRAAAHFELELSGVQGALLDNLAKGNRPREKRKAIVESALAAAAKALDGDDFALSEKLLKFCRGDLAKTADKALTARVNALDKQRSDLLPKFEQVRTHVERLRTQPDDAVANYQVGWYRCRVKGRWDLGLPLLAKGSDETLRKLAADDMAAAVTGPELLALGDRWWELAEKERDAQVVKRLRLHAAGWYHQAATLLSGTEMGKAETRVRQSGLETRMVNSLDGSELVLVPAGKFLAGKEKTAVHLPAYYIGVCKVTRAQFVNFVRATNFEVRAGGNLSLEKDMARWPIDDITWEAAAAYCRWAGLRLPTEMEWEKAARGLDGREYPWGNEFDSGKCACKIGEKIGSPTPVDACPDGRSPWGLFNACGLIWEYADGYCEERAAAYARYARGDLAPAASGALRLQRGGSRWDERPSCLSRRSWAVGEGGGVGFRVARDAGP